MIAAFDIMGAAQLVTPMRLRTVLLAMDVLYRYACCAVRLLAEMVI